MRDMATFRELMARDLMDGLAWLALADLLEEEGEDSSVARFCGLVASVAQIEGPFTPDWPVHCDRGGCSGIGAWREVPFLLIDGCHLYWPSEEHGAGENIIMPFMSDDGEEWGCGRDTDWQWWRLWAAVAYSPTGEQYLYPQRFLGTLDAYRCLLCGLLEDPGPFDAVRVVVHRTGIWPDPIRRVFVWEDDDWRDVPFAGL